MHQAFTIYKLCTGSNYFNLYDNFIALSLFYQEKKCSTEKLAILPKVIQLVIVELGVELGQSDVNTLTHFADAVTTYLLLPTHLHTHFHSIHFPLRISENKNEGTATNK